MWGRPLTGPPHLDAIFFLRLTPLGWTSQAHNSLGSNFVQSIHCNADVDLDQIGKLRAPQHEELVSEIGRAQVTIAREFTPRTFGLSLLGPDTSVMIVPDGVAPPFGHVTFADYTIWVSLYPGAVTYDDLWDRMKWQDSIMPASLQISIGGLVFGDNDTVLWLNGGERPVTGFSLMYEKSAR
jgi:hypothetical protein